MPERASLNLWKKKLGRVPDSVWEQTALETLVLAENDLSEVSDKIGQLAHLRMLDLGHNQLTGIPETLGNVESLRDFLYLHDNQLTELPDSYLRYLMNALRDSFNLKGTPIRFSLRTSKNPYAKR